MRSLKINFEVRRHIRSAKMVSFVNKNNLEHINVSVTTVYGYFTQANCKYFYKIFNDFI